MLSVVLPELTICNRDSVAHEAEKYYCLAFYRKCWSTSDLENCLIEEETNLCVAPKGGTGARGERHGARELIPAREASSNSLSQGAEDCPRGGKPPVPERWEQMLRPLGAYDLKGILALEDKAYLDFKAVLVQAAITELPQAGWLQQVKFISHSFGGRKFKIKVWAGLLSLKALSLAFRQSTSCCVLIWSFLDAHPWCLSLPLRTRVLLH